MRENRFLIISEPRSGSNNISYCLAAHPDLVVGNELLHPRNGVRPEAYGLDNDIANDTGYHWIHRVDAELRSAVLSGLFERHNGFKIHTQHIPVEMIVEIVHAYDCHVILTKRLSIFDQAISNYIATARNRWHADEKISRMVDAQPFDIPEEHFVQWVEGILAVRRALWSRFRDMADRVILIEYESFYSGNHEARVHRVNTLYRMLGLKKLGEFDKVISVPAYAKLQHYLDPGRQKLTDAGLTETLIRNYAAIRQVHALWVMRSYDKLSTT